MVELLNKKMSYAANPLFEWRDSFIQLKSDKKGYQPYIKSSGEMSGNLSGWIEMNPNLMLGGKALRASFLNWQTSKKDFTFVQSLLEKTLAQT